MSNIAMWTLLLQLAATLTMVGIIWFVQIVHYPLFAQVGRQDFRRYEMDHQRLTSWVVGPPMLVELLSCSALLWLQPELIPASALWLSLALLLTVWCVTYTVQVPQHASLVLSYDSVTQRRLVLGNWIRTVAWTARGLLVLWMVGEAMAASVVSPNAEVVHISMP